GSFRLPGQRVLGQVLRVPELRGAPEAQAHSVAAAGAVVVRRLDVPVRRVVRAGLRVHGIPPQGRAGWLVSDRQPKPAGRPLRGVSPCYTFTLRAAKGGPELRVRLERVVPAQRLQVVAAQPLVPAGEPAADLDGAGGLVEGDGHVVLRIGDVATVSHLAVTVNPHWRGPGTSGGP